ncbi:MAG: hypothetical protein R2724_24325 [Bryobacterales bacterium]
MAARAARIRQALDTLRDFLTHAARQPLIYLICARGCDGGSTLQGVERISDDPCSEALRRFGSSALIWTEAFRAIRIAELEVENAYLPQRHDAAVANIDWESASVEELEALPAFVVAETAEGLGERSLTSWGRLLRSGQPIQVIVERPAGLSLDDLGGAISPDFGFMAMAYHEAGRRSAALKPAVLLKGLARMARSLRPCMRP